MLTTSKPINDAHGHLAGDHVLGTVAERIQKGLRIEDVLCRYGGEEFVAILSGTDPEEALVVAERVRHLIASDPVVNDNQKINVTISIGLGTLLDKNFDSPKMLVASADHYLYTAQQGGRNRTASAEFARNRRKTVPVDSTP